MNLQPVEESFHYSDFYGPAWGSSDFDAKPMVLVLGQYSVGKTTFIRHMLGREFPGSDIGPEPTTDRWSAVMHAAADRIIPGNALTVDESMPFKSLQEFGSHFLNKMQGVMCHSPMLENLTFVDSPGVLTGRRQTLGRSYDFVKVGGRSSTWFIAGHMLNVLTVPLSVCQCELTSGSRFLASLARDRPCRWLSGLPKRHT